MPGTLPTLCPAQLRRTLRAYGITSRAVLDVGPPLALPGSPPATLRTLTDKVEFADSGATSGERVELAGSIPVAPHACSAVIVRQARLLQAADPRDLEPVVAIANLLSCLKPRGWLLACLAEPAEAAHWDQLLHGFPGRGQFRRLEAGWLARCWLPWLTRPAAPVLLFEFRLARARISRLQWHMLARRRFLQQRSAAA